MHRLNLISLQKEFAHLEPGPTSENFRRSCLAGVPRSSSLSLSFFLEAVRKSSAPFSVQKIPEGYLLTLEEPPNSCCVLQLLPLRSGALGSSYLERTYAFLIAFFKAAFLGVSPQARYPRQAQSVMENVQAQIE
jgi:hypothetical protein